MQATRILAIRHGETAWNVDTRIQGHLDIPLNAKGLWQAEQLAKTLATQDPLHAVYSSDLQRAHQTATAVAVQHGGLTGENEMEERETRGRRRCNRRRLRA